MNAKWKTAVSVGFLSLVAYLPVAASEAIAQGFGQLIDIAWRPFDGHAYGVTSSGDVFANPGYCGQWAWTGRLPSGASPLRILDGDVGGDLLIGCANGQLYAVSGSLPLISLSACGSIGAATGTFVDIAWRNDGIAYAVTTAGEILVAPAGCGQWALAGRLPAGEIPACILDNDVGASIEIGCRSGNFYEVIGTLLNVSTTFCSSLQGMLHGELVDIAWRLADGHAYAVTDLGAIYANSGTCGEWNLAGSMPLGEVPVCVLDGDVGGSMDIGCRSGNAYTVIGPSSGVTLSLCSSIIGIPTSADRKSWGLLKRAYR